MTERENTTVNRKTKRYLLLAGGLFLIFTAFTVLVSVFDVQPIGPLGSRVGFASLNRAVHNLTGVHLALYALTDWLMLVPFAVCMAFGALGLCQLIARRSLRRVDRSLLFLGGFYIAVIAVYLFFEYYVVNYRPVLIDGVLEASYPSSTTVLVLCVMPTAAMMLRARSKNRTLVRRVNGLIFAFTAFMVIGRLLSGVHWLTDILGGALISASLVTMVSPFIRVK